MEELEVNREGVKKPEIHINYVGLTFKRDGHHLLKKPAPLEEEPVLDEKNFKGYQEHSYKGRR